MGQFGAVWVELFYRVFYGTLLEKLQPVPTSIRSSVSENLTKPQGIERRSNYGFFAGCSPRKRGKDDGHVRLAATGVNAVRKAVVTSTREHINRALRPETLENASTPYCMMGS